MLPTMADNVHQNFWIDNHRMAAHQTSFSDIFLQACDAYLDAASCKQYTAALFSSDAFSADDSKDIDTREDYFTVCGLGVDGSERHDHVGKCEYESSLVGIFRPLPPLAKEEDDNTAKRSAELAKEIFRSKRSKNFARDSDYADLMKLYRCTAWSMDSNGSIEASSRMIAQKTNAVNLVHWDDVVEDSDELHRRFVVARD